MLYLAETSGPAFTIRVLAGDDQRRDLFRRWSRWFLLREPGDVAQTALAATEHELLMLVPADRAGARVVEPAIAYPVAGGGALLATTPVTTTILRNGPAGRWSIVRDNPSSPKVFWSTDFHRAAWRPARPPPRRPRRMIVRWS
ncbi:hypothetical protein [Nocardia sp. NPDC004860]|uniref:hypothetical protein n=1 Tax=Nocardia sp. NPDC004860 TaxID=3154557 RepID=UPI0033BE5CDC